MRSVSHKQATSRSLRLRVLIPLSILIGLSASELTYPDPTSQTILVGLDHRAGLLQSFEGYVTMKKFYGPASERQEKPGQDASPWACVFFYVLDEPKDRWIIERKRYDVESRPAAVPGLPDHEVSVLSAGIRASKPVHERYWHAATEEIEFDRSKDTLMETLLVLSRMSRYAELPTTVAEDKTDQGELLRLQVKYPARGEAKAIQYFWVDPAKGFAIAKWVIVGLRDGKIVTVSSRHAYGFHEYSPGLWLPQRTVWVESSVPDGSQLTWKTLTIREVIQARVNEPLTEDYFGGLIFTDQMPTNSYQPRLIDDAIVEVQENDGTIQGGRKEASLGDVVDKLLADIGKGPGTPGSFVEPLPE